ncbi:hypothetical protein K470DRAFT_259322 [Piedraia hortae CBS 480.64]|uniref:Uncharacterized protein n=1 Tax=Piedraia hortae CBS 480.64 TaxID=1314780 RepID=A0A6A7BUC2_9PEZI|nr:hypothetical protein K470DRAFT_259322 [Piedraia hortae CBS 480.64]
MPYLRSVVRQPRPQPVLTLNTQKESSSELTTAQQNRPQAKSTHTTQKDGLSNLTSRIPTLTVQQPHSANEPPAAHQTFTEFISQNHTLTLSIPPHASEAIFLTGMELCPKSVIPWLSFPLERDILFSSVQNIFSSCQFQSPSKGVEMLCAQEVNVTKLETVLREIPLLEIFAKIFGQRTVQFESSGTSTGFVMHKGERVVGVEYLDLHTDLLVEGLGGITRFADAVCSNHGPTRECAKLLARGYDGMVRKGLMYAYLATGKAVVLLRRNPLLAGEVMFHVCVSTGGMDRGETVLGTLVAFLVIAVGVDGRDDEVPKEKTWRRLEGECMDGLRRSCMGLTKDLGPEYAAGSGSIPVSEESTGPDYLQGLGLVSNNVIWNGFTPGPIGPDNSKALKLKPEQESPLCNGLTFSVGGPIEPNQSTALKLTSEQASGNGELSTGPGHDKKVERMFEQALHIARVPRRSTAAGKHQLQESSPNCATCDGHTPVFGRSTRLDKVKALERIAEQAGSQQSNDQTYAAPDGKMTLTLNPGEPKIPRLATPPRPDDGPARSSGSESPCVRTVNSTKASSGPNSGATSPRSLIPLARPRPKASDVVSQPASPSNENGERNSTGTTSPRKTDRKKVSKYSSISRTRIQPNRNSLHISFPTTEQVQPPPLARKRPTHPKVVALLTCPLRSQKEDPIPKRRETDDEYPSVFLDENYTPDMDLKHVIPYGISFKPQMRSKTTPPPERLRELVLDEIMEEK